MESLVTELMDDPPRQGGGGEEGQDQGNRYMYGVRKFNIGCFSRSVRKGVLGGNRTTYTSPPIVWSEPDAMAVS